MIVPAIADICTFGETLDEAGDMARDLCALSKALRFNYSAFPIYIQKVVVRFG